MPEKTEIKKTQCICFNMYCCLTLYWKLKEKQNDIDMWRFTHERKSGTSLISQSFLGSLLRIIWQLIFFGPSKRSTSQWTYWNYWTNTYSFLAEIYDINSFQGYKYLREISQHFRHLVSSFSASYVDNDVRVGKLGERLGNNSFSTTKGSWDSCCSTLNTPVWEQPFFP